MNKEITDTTSKPNYKKTLRACYLGFITQAITANFAPLVFLKLHHDYQIPLGLIALIPTAFFFTQLVVDIFCARFVDKIGYRVSIVTSEVFSAIGLIALAFLPDVLPSAFVGMISQKAGDNLQRGLFFGGIFPVILIVFLIILKLMKGKN